MQPYSYSTPRPHLLSWTHRLTSFVDSSFADVIENRKSTGELIHYIGTSPVYWDSFVANTTVSLSTAESEYVAPHVAGKEIMATNNILVELNYV